VLRFPRYEGVNVFGVIAYLVSFDLELCYSPATLHVHHFLYCLTGHFSLDEFKVK
jgi:hypothetical protein